MPHKVGTSRINAPSGN